MSDQTSKETSVAVIGLGLMGAAIAANLVKAGFPTTGYDPDPDAQLRARAMGVTLARSASDAIQGAAFVLSSLPDAAALAALAESAAETPVPPGPRPIVLELSTLPVAAKQDARIRFSEHGRDMLDAPVSGTGAQAISGDIVVYASGDDLSFERSVKIMTAFSRKAVYLGNFGNGMKMKCVANLLVSIHNVATAEAINLGIRAGLDAQVVYDLISAGAGTSKIFELRGPMMVRNTYQPPSMKLGVWRKDLDLISDFAASMAAPTPLFDVTTELYDAAISLVGPTQDTAAVFAAVRSLTRKN